MTALPAELTNPPHWDDMTVLEIAAAAARVDEAREAIQDA